MQVYADMTLAVPQTLMRLTRYLAAFAHFLKFLPAGQLPVRLPLDTVI